MRWKPGGRLVRTAGWLLTPLVVWAASFLGGWFGALIGRGNQSLMGGAAWLLGGSVAGGLAGLLTWLWIMSRRRVARRERKRAPVPPPAQPPPAPPPSPPEPLPPEMPGRPDDDA